MERKYKKNTALLNRIFLALGTEQVLQVSTTKRKTTYRDSVLY